MPVNARVAAERQRRHDDRMAAAAAVVPEGGYCYSFTGEMRETTLPDGSTIYGAVQSFTIPPVVSTYQATGVTSSSASLSGSVTAAAGVPFADLYSHITAFCGERYAACALCDDEPWREPGAPPGAHCGYHYTPQGYAYIVEFLAPLVAALVKGA